MAKPEKDRDEDAMELGKEKMFEFAEKAHEVDSEKNAGKNEGICLRFLGRAADYQKDYPKAKEYYEKGIKALPKDSRSILELRAFKAFSTTMMGDVDTGMEEARQVFDDFFDSEMGKNLKQDDYFVWAVWMSGIAPRQLHALEEIGAEYDSEEMKKWLEATKNELENLSGEVTWGDDKFQFRIDELNSSLGKIVVIVLLPLVGIFLS
jgi:hypothetical protein